MSSPFVGPLTDYIGCEIPLLMGSVIMFLSTAMLSCDSRVPVFFFVRVFHGLASALVENGAFVALATLFKTKLGRYKVFGFVLEFAAFGYYSELSILIDSFLPILDKTLYLILGLLPLATGMYLFLVTMRLKKEEAKDFRTTKPYVTPMWKLLVDPYIVLSAGALMLSNIPLVFLQKTSNIWLTDDIKVIDDLKMNLMWYMFFAQGLGIVCAVSLTVKYSGYGWLMTLSGLLLESLCCFGIPLTGSYHFVQVLVCVVAFAVGLVRCALLPNFAHLMDVRHVAVYGGVYAIANGFGSAGYVISPLVAYLNLQAAGFPMLVVTIGILCALYAPVLLYLRGF